MNSYIGNYYATNSIIHKLDPRVKLFFVMIYVILTFLVTSLKGYCLLFVGLFIVIKLTNIPLKVILKMLNSIVAILIFTNIVHLFFTDGDIIFKFKFMVITKQGLYNAVYITLRLILMILTSSLLTLTTTSTQFSDAIEKNFKFLNRFGIKVEDISMMISISIRFIPIILEEVDIIIKAQKARGVDFEHGTLINKIKNIIPILIPVFISSIKRSIELAKAMEVRLYTGENRTKLHPLKYNKIDKITYIVICLFAGMVVILEQVKIL